MFNHNQALTQILKNGLLNQESTENNHIGTIFIMGKSESKDGLPLIQQMQIKLKTKFPSTLCAQITEFMNIR